MIQNIKHHASVPVNPVEGDHYYNTIDLSSYIYTGGEWKVLTFHSDAWVDKKIIDRKKKIKSIYEL